MEGATILMMAYLFGTGVTAMAFYFKYQNAAAKTGTPWYLALVTDDEVSPHADEP